MQLHLHTPKRFCEPNTKSYLVRALYLLKHISLSKLNMLVYSLNLTIPASEVLWTSSLLFVLSVDFHLHQLIFLCIL